MSRIHPLARTTPRTRAEIREATGSDEPKRRYLFVAIDRATRWVYVRIYKDQDENSSVDFLRRLKQAAPMKITTILTDNGSQFTDRFTSQDKVPTGRHAFDKLCAEFGIAPASADQRHGCSRGPNSEGELAAGMRQGNERRDQRFNGRIAEVIEQTRLGSTAELVDTIERYVEIYNQHIPQRALQHQTPLQAIETWRVKSPESFVDSVNNLAGLDT